MITKFEEIYEAVKGIKRKRVISVAMADDFSVLSAIKEVSEKGIADALLVGDSDKIREISKQIGYQVREESIIHAKEPDEIATRSVELVNSHQADILMKGHISTPVLMKAVLDKEKGLRTGEILSHVAVTEVQTYHKLILLSDGGINILPDLETKKSIVRNIIYVANRLQVKEPKIAVLCPIEKVNPKIQETVDAAELQNIAENGEFGSVILEGPIATDVALSAEAAKRKGINSRIAGDTDAFLVPNLTTGNAFIKVLMFLANAKVGGIVVGAKVPIVLLSRADKPTEKLNSIALSILLC